MICQFFIEQLLRGASLGRALLEARLAYVRKQSVVDPYDEKTLAQFVLLGDPSLHPFVEAQATPKTATSPAAKAVVHAARQQRRVRLMKAGERLARGDRLHRAGKRAQGGSHGLARPGDGRGAPAVQARANLRGPRARRPSPGRRQGPEDDAEGPSRCSWPLGAVRRPPADTPPRIDGLLAYEVNGQLVVRIVLQSR